MSETKKIALVLGGGGARGLAHIGIICELVKAGIPITSIYGVSMGAIVGAFFALGLDMEKVAKDALLWNKRRVLRELMDIGLPAKSILKGEKAARLIAKYIGQATFADTKIPLQVVATDLSDGSEVVIRDGLLAPALQASWSVPGIFPPVKIGDRWLIDGGVVNPTPVNLALADQADLIIAVDLVLQDSVEIDEPGLLFTLLQSYEIIRAQTLREQLSKLPDNCLLLRPSIRETLDSFKFYDVERFISSGRELAKQYIPDILAKI